MPEKRTVQRARRKLRQGKSPGTAAGEFVREELRKKGIKIPKRNAHPSRRRSAASQRRLQRAAR